MLSGTKNVSVKNRLREAFQSQMRIAAGTEQHLSGTLQETLQRPGSMVRAELAYRLGVASGLDESRSECIAISVEYFHTASLLFDDLPCMDNATERRGERCIHHVFGEGAAILAALALINRAYALLWEGTARLPPEVQRNAVKYVERQLGLTGVLNGQSQDLYYFTLPSAARVPQNVALGKTVSLIRLALVLPAVAGNAPGRELHLLERLAAAWGLSYQTLDDLKDLLHTSEQGGKTAARDAHLDRPNIAISIGVEQAFQYLERLMQMSDRIIARLIQRKGGLAFLAGVREQFNREVAELSESRTAVHL